MPDYPQKSTHSGHPNNSAIRVLCLAREVNIIVLIRESIGNALTGIYSGLL